jgi:hypothetical protein
VAEIITFPDVETLVVSVLNTTFPTRGETSLKASTRVPNPRPAEFVKVLGGGGLDETKVSEAALITIEGWAATEARAFEICELARAILRSQDGDIRGVRGFSYPQNLPDPATKQVRYTSTGDVRVWGTTTP